MQNVSGIRDLVGSDVNLIHRLMKNHITEATGWKAYVLFTERCREHLNIASTDLHSQTESYEHLGETQTYSYDLRGRYESIQALHKDVVAAERSLISFELSYPVPPSVVWDWLNDPLKRAIYTYNTGPRFIDVLKPGGRRGVGAKTHCIHGQDLAMEETVLDWYPFDYLTVRQTFQGFDMRMTCYLEPSQDGQQTQARF